MALKTHCKITVSKTFTDYNGKEYTFEANKLNSVTVSTKMFPIAKAIGTAVGAGIDNSKVGMTWTAFTMQIQDNLNGELFEEIRDLLFAELFCDKERVTYDWFDEDEYRSGMLMDIFFWLAKENFGNFIVRNGMFQRCKTKLEAMVGTDLTEKVEELLNSKN